MAPSLAVAEPPPVIKPSANVPVAQAAEPARTSTSSAGHDYKGFVAGVFSGVAKLTVGHPFDTVKVRMQTTDASRFRGPLECAMQTLRNEGVRGLYKGATPPLLGWMFMDSIMMGSLNVYRRLLSDRVYGVDKAALPSVGHGVAGMMAGATVSFIAAPVEHIKARLQIQYAAKKADRRYSGPLDCLGRIYKHHGVQGVFHGLSATLVFRAFFFFWWSSYNVISNAMRRHTDLSTPAINFWAGGLSAQVYWLTCYPSDVVKQRIMTDPLGGGLGDGQRRFPRWKDAARTIYQEQGIKGYWRGFLPCFLRAFPANAMALLVWEGVFRSLPG
ncbi:mitochondrial carrier domain-containing protein [Emericellopsis atlantica]|uniref:Mitochondrial carrier domain-containing protein n=1 Tax=Emericellopsis atlantica TaxID=2614577 RepID=A0A9P8CKW7_9HYPO|nr:mitochondrial carrier domain-containing protein [Emericellopsis atlantica]KAG9250467.1 mitochondrial carrier domain-containing protein [Emericellopsis atlantica]